MFLLYSFQCLSWCLFLTRSHTLPMTDVQNGSHTRCSRTIATRNRKHLESLLRTNYGIIRDVYSQQTTLSFNICPLLSNAPKRTFLLCAIRHMVFSCAPAFRVGRYVATVGSQSKTTCVAGRHGGETSCSLWESFLTMEPF